MKHHYFSSRREQIEKDLVARVLKAKKIAGFSRVVRDEMRSVAVVGAYEERDWCLNNIRAAGCLSPDQKGLLEKAIMSKGILEVLG